MRFDPVMVDSARLRSLPLFAGLAARGHYEPVLNATLLLAVAAGLATAVL